MMNMQLILFILIIFVSSTLFFAYLYIRQKRALLIQIAQHVDLKGIIDSSTDSIWSVDREYRIININPIFQQTFHQAYNVLLKSGDSGLDNIPDPLRAYWKEIYRRGFAGERFWDEQHYQFEHDLPDIYAEVSVNPVRNKKGDVIAVSIISRDITNRKLTENELAAKEANVSALIENTRNAIWSIDKSYRITSINSRFKAAYQNLYGVELDIGSNIIESAPTDTQRQWRKLYDRALSGEQFVDIQHYHPPDIGVSLIFEVSFNPIEDQTGNIVGVSIFSHDITESKLAKEAMANSEMRLRSILETSQDAIWAIDKEYKITMMNSQLQNRCMLVFGTTPKVGHSLEEVTSDIYQTQLKPLYDRALSGQIFSEELAFSILNSDSIMYTDVTFNPIIDENGEIAGVSVFSRDVTARKQIENALAEREVSLKAIINNTKDFIWSVDQEYRTIITNQANADNFEAQFSVPLTKGTRAVDHLSEDRKLAWDRYYQRAFKGERFAVEEHLLLINGKDLHVEMSLNPILDQSGEVTGVSVFSRDITNRKSAEQALARSEANLRALTENTREFIWSVDTDYCIITGNSTYLEYFRDQYHVELKEGMRPIDFQPHERQEFWTDIYERALSGEHFTAYDHRDYGAGREIYIEILANPISDEDEIISGVSIFIRDITDRKLVEKALAASEGQLRAILENSHDAIWSIDGNLRITHFNAEFLRRYQEHYGITLAVGNHILKDVPIPVEYVPKWEKLYQRALDGEQFTIETDITLISNPSETYYVELSLNPILNSDNEVTGVSVFSRDITDRKSAEEAIRTSEARYRSVVEDQIELIARFTPEMIVTFANSAYCNFYNKTSKEVVGFSFVPNILPEVRNRVVEAIQNLSITHPMEAIEHQVKSGTGEIRWLQWTNRAIFGDEDRLIEYQSIGRDITVRKHAEQQLQDTLSRTNTLYKISQTLIAVTSIDELMQSIVNSMSHALSAARTHAILMDVENRQVFDYYISYDDIDHVKGITFDELWNGLTGWVLREHNALLSPKHIVDERESEYVRQRRAENRVGSLIVAPFKYGDSIFGTITVINELDQRDFTEDDLDLVTAISNQASVAINNAQLFEGLRRSEERYRAVVEDQTEVICRYSPELTFTFVNEAYCRFSQKPRHEHIGRSIFDETYTEAHDIVREHIESLTIDNPAAMIEHQAVTASGEKRWYQWIDRAIFDENGTLIEYQGIGRDITEQRKVQDALQQSEKRFSQAFYSSPVAMTIVTLETGEYIDVNDSFLEIVGYERDEIIGMTNDDLGVLRSKDQRKQLVQQLRTKEIIRNIESPCLTKNGKIRLMLFSSVLFDTTHEQRVVSAVRDMTEEYRLEELRVQNEARHRAISELISDYAYEIRINPDNSMNLEWVTDAFARATGITIEELATPSDWLRIIHPNDHRKAIVAFNKAIRDGIDTEAQYRFFAKDGQIRVVQMYFRAIWDETEQRVVRVYLAGQDITHQKAAEAHALQVATQQQQIAALRAFIANTSHHFKNPLSVLNTSVYLLENYEETSIHQQQVAVIKRQIAYLDQLITSLLTMSKLDDDPEFAYDRVSVATIIRDVETRIESVFTNPAVKFVTEIPANISPINADSTQLSQAIYQLLENAVQFTETGTVTLRVIEKDQHVLIEVEDTGCGIHQRDLPFVFDRFYKVDKARTSIEHPGLGLTITKTIVELHNGEIEVFSKIDKGSTFRISIPISDIS